MEEILWNKLQDLWFIYGNNGKKHTDGNHKFIQRLIEGNGDMRKFYKPTKECIDEVDKVMKGEL